MGENIQHVGEDEDFTVVEVLRDGAHGRVERVVDPDNGTRWIRRTYDDDRREVFRALARIESPQIPKILQISFADRTTVVEEEVPGAPLSERILAGDLTPDDAMRIAVQLLEALRLLQGQSVVHRDIKPDNVIVKPDGGACLIDFGISRIHRAGATGDTSLFGTAGYAPPEQFGFAQTDARADIYSLGVLIREMCGNRTGRTWRVLRAVADKCASFDPDARYPDAGTALRALRSLRRRPHVYAAAAALLLSLTCLGTYIAAAWPPPSEPSIQEQRGEHFKIVKSHFEPEHWGYSVVLADGEMWTKRGRLAPGERPIEVEATLSGATLAVSLRDRRHPQRTFSFHNDSPSPIKSYDDTTIFAELLFDDLDDDGRKEIIVSLSDRLQPTNVHWLQNWSMTWCIGYTPDDGFWLAESSIETVTNNSDLRVSLFGLTRETILLRNYPSAFYMLRDRTLQAYIFE